MCEDTALIPGLFQVDGIRLGTTSAGIREPGRRDLVLVEIAAGSTCSAVFTQNAFCAAPVTIARRHLADRTPRFLIINSGNANAGTGNEGISDALACCESLASLGGCLINEILPFSTGVIGESLPVTRIEQALPAAYRSLNAGGWEDAAYGLMTTDTVPKGISRRITIEGNTITVTGIAKGAGMINPDMATMLAFIATDAGIHKDLLSECLGKAVAESFNCISVDGDTSTNDACALMATGRSRVPGIRNSSEQAYSLLSGVVTDVCVELAQAIIRDAEGATKFLSIYVEQGMNETECRAIAANVAHSPLVKTAFYAEDPNWGRILAAIGRTNIQGLDINRINVYLDEVCIVRGGCRSPEYTEAQGQEVMHRDEIAIRIELGRGNSEYTLWTCDLSQEYVRINSDYRT